MNFISQIKDAAGHWIEDMEGIKALAVNFFSTLFPRTENGGWPRNWTFLSQN